jgi:hypothetical protein
MPTLDPSTNPLRGRTLGGEVGAFDGGDERLVVIWSGYRAWSGTLRLNEKTN